MVLEPEVKPIRPTTVGELLDLLGEYHRATAIKVYDASSDTWHDLEGLRQVEDDDPPEEVLRGDLVLCIGS